MRRKGNLGFEQTQQARLHMAVYAFTYASATHAFTYASATHASVCLCTPVCTYK